MKVSGVFLACFSVLFAVSDIFGASYKVESFNGVPFVTVDGKPVRSRHFLGWMGGGKSPDIGSDWRDYHLDFSHAEDSVCGGIKILVGNDVSDLYISRLELENLDDGSRIPLYDFSASPYDKSKLSWLFPKEIDPQPVISIKNENIGGESILHINKIQKDLTCDRLVFHLRHFEIKKGVKYRFHIRAKTDLPSRLYLISYILSPYEVIAENRKSFLLKQEKIAADAGVDFIHFGVPTLWNLRDFSSMREIDNAFNAVIAVNPDAKIIVRIGTESEAHRRAHPDEVMVDSDGKPITRGYDGANYSSPSSKSFRAAVAEGVRNTIEYIESKFPDNIAGYHPCGGQSGEFFYGASGQWELAGYDKATLTAWRKWLANKYKTPEALQKAWNSPKLTPFKAVEVPDSRARREATTHLMNPKVNAPAIDFNTFLQDEMADHVLGIAKVVRETTKKLGVDRLSLVFFGYAYELSGYPNGPAVSGHYALKRILDSPYVDIASGPISYSLRGLGGMKLTMSAADSFANSGKMWFDEDDNRTYLIWTSGTPLLVADPAQRTVEDTRKVMRRNLAQQTIRNHGSWWMDLFGGGWFNDPEIWIEMKKFRKSELDMIRRPQPYRPPVALIHSDRAVMHIGGNRASQVTSAPLLHSSRIAMSKSGIPFGQYILEDILERKFSAKLNVFLLASALTAQERKTLAEVSGQSAAIWCWTPGLVDLEKGDFSCEAVKELTGFDVSCAGDTEATVYSTKEGREAGLPEKFGPGAKIKPLLAVEAREGDVVLAKYSNGKNAVVLRRAGEKSKMFVGTTMIPTELYRHMAAVSGLHIYTKQPAAVYANGGYVSVTANSSEPHEIDLGYKNNVYDAVSGKRVGKGPVLKFDMEKGDVKFLRLGKGNESADKAGRQVRKGEEKSEAASQ